MRRALGYSISSGSRDTVLSQGWADIDISIRSHMAAQDEDMAYRSALAVVHAGPAGLQFAVLALEDEPMRA